MGKNSRASSSISSSSSSTTMDFLLVEDLDFVHVEDQGLSHWEVINASDADSDKEQEPELDEKQEEEEEEEEEDKDSLGNGCGSLGSDSENSMPVTLKIDKMEIHHVDLYRDDYDVDVKDCHGYGDGYSGEQRDHDHDEDEDGDEDDDGYDLDDELVPWNVSDKFGRQRMRKLGKRAFPKMYNSKRSPYLFVRPGCVRGKHGLGLKHNY